MCLLRPFLTTVGFFGLFAAGSCAPASQLIETVTPSPTETAIAQSTATVIAPTATLTTPPTTASPAVSPTATALQSSQSTDVKTVQEATALAGFQVVEPSFVPEGFQRVRITVVKLPFGSAPTTVEQHWEFRGSNGEFATIDVIQDPMGPTIGGEPFMVGNVQGERYFRPRSGSNAYSLVVFAWKRDGMGFQVAGSVKGDFTASSALTEESVVKVAKSVQ